MQKKYKRLLSNSILFLLAQFGSKVLMLLVVPFYTYLLSPAEFGTIELSTTTLTIAAPICMLLIYDAVLRFSMSTDLSKVNVFTAALKVWGIGSLFTLIVLPISCLIPALQPYAVLVYFLIVSYGLFYTITQFAKGIDVNAYVLSGVIYTVLFLCGNIYFIVYLQQGVFGYILSQVLGYILAACFCIVRIKAWKYIDFGAYTQDTTKQMLNYSMLLIPNALVWWIIASANRYFIEYFIGADANGVFGIAAKIPNIITIVGTILIQAWQLSAIEEKEMHADVESQSAFYTNVFDIYATGLIIGSSFLILICRPILTVVLSEDFKVAWIYVPWLLLSAIYMMYAQYWSSLFVAEKSTKELSSSSIIVGLLSLALNGLLIPKLGLLGAALGCFISCFVMWIIRMIAAKRFKMIKVDLKREISALFLLVVQSIFCIQADGMTSLITGGIVFVLLCVLYRKTIKGVIELAYKMLGGKLK